MDRVQLPQGYRHSDKAVYFLPLFVICKRIPQWHVELIDQKAKTVIGKGQNTHQINDNLLATYYLGKKYNFYLQFTIKSCL